jgi:hypothetical protein
MLRVLTITLEVLRESDNLYRLVWLERLGRLTQRPNSWVEKLEYCGVGSKSARENIRGKTSTLSGSLPSAHGLWISESIDLLVSKLRASLQIRCD